MKIAINGRFFQRKCNQFFCCPSTELTLGNLHPAKLSPERKHPTMVRPLGRHALWIVPSILLSGTARAEDTEQKTPPVKTSQKTPSQKLYGLPVNPIIGGAVDTDLSKPLTLDRAVKIGLALQNTIAIAKSQADGSRARLTQSLSSYFPQVKPSIQYNSNLQPGGVINFGGTLIKSGANSETFSTGINATINIWDTGQREATVGSSRHSLYSAEYGVANQRQAVVFSVTQSYYNLERARALVKVQADSVTRAKTNLELISENAKQGTAAKSDTLQAEADYANAQVSYLSAQNDYNIAQATLKNAIGVVTSEPLNIPDEALSPPSLQGDSKNIEDYIKVAYTTRYDIKEQQEVIRSQDYQLKSAKISSGLTVNANVTEGYQLDPNTGQNRTFTVAFSYPLFDGGSTKAAVDQSRATLEQARRTLDQLEQGVRLNVEQSWLVRELARRRVDASNTAQRAADLNFQVAQEKQKQGLVNILELITAQVQLTNAQSSYVQALYDFYIADASLLRNVGVNDPQYKPNVPGAKPIRSMMLLPTGMQSAGALKP